MISNYIMFEDSINNNVKIEILKDTKEFSKKFKDVKITKNHIVYAINNLEGGIIISIKPKPYLNVQPDIAISWFYISDKLRGKGIGDQLIKRVLNDYKGKTIGLSTATGVSNDPAINLYKKYGFKVFYEKGRTKYWIKDN